MNGLNMSLKCYMAPFHLANLCCYRNKTPKFPSWFSASTTRAVSVLGDITMKNTSLFLYQCSVGGPSPPGLKWVFFSLEWLMNLSGASSALCLFPLRTSFVELLDNWQGSVSVNKKTSFPQKKNYWFTQINYMALALSEKCFY